ncbi:hypothetical protein KAW18_12180 [candidate division WOR-3 bacterium]|nr:hypothetical protein [candidate division WOR-3 bacterium]
MIHLSFQVENITSVLQVYNQIQVQSSVTETGTFTMVVGTGFPIILISGQSAYSVDDPNGFSSTWYQSRYYDSETEVASAWSVKILGSVGELCYDPTYGVEVEYSTSDQLVIDRIRRLCGDPIGLKREYNEKDNIHEGGKVYQLEEKGWPCSITVGDTTYNSTSNPTVNGYLYLNFSDDITTLSGVDLDVNIFYYTFRNSDRELFEAYKYCTPPQGLTRTTANSEAYMLQIAIDILMQELWEDATEDGASVKDDVSTYNSEGGQKIRNDLIDKLQKRLDNLIKTLILGGISGVRID